MRNKENREMVREEENEDIKGDINRKKKGKERVKCKDCRTGKREDRTIQVSLG